MLTVADDVQGERTIRLVNDWGSADIALYGGQVLSWKNAAGAEYLFVSGRRYREAGKAVRGGIPVCWPWFGPHPANPSLAQHGFVRTLVWHPGPVCEIGDRTRIVLSCSDDDRTRSVWNFSFRLDLEIALGPSLELTLSSTNTGSSPFSITDALHSYFLADSASRVRISGFAGAAFTDSLAAKGSADARRIESGEVAGFGSCVDRVYHAEGPSVLYGLSAGAGVQLSKDGFPDTVVWNPGPDLAESMADLGRAEAECMVCMEAALASPKVVAPGQTLVQKMMLSPVV